MSEAWEACNPNSLLFMCGFYIPRQCPFFGPFIFRNFDHELAASIRWALLRNTGSSFGLVCIRPNLA